MTVTHVVRHLRFASRNGCEAGWKAWSSHVGVRIKTLEKQQNGHLQIRDLLLTCEKNPHVVIIKRENVNILGNSLICFLAGSHS